MNDVKTYRLESSCFLLIRTIKLLLCLLVRVDFVGLVVVVVSTAFAKSKDAWEDFTSDQNRSREK